MGSQSDLRTEVLGNAKSLQSGGFLPVSLRLRERPRARLRFQRDKVWTSNLLPRDRNRSHRRGNTD